MARSQQLTPGIVGRPSGDRTAEDPDLKDRSANTAGAVSSSRLDNLYFPRPHSTAFGKGAADLYINQKS